MAEVIRFFGITYPTFAKYSAMPIYMAEKLEAELVGRFGDEFSGVEPPEKKSCESNDFVVSEAGRAKAVRSFELSQKRNEKHEAKAKASYEKRIAKQQKKKDIQAQAVASRSAVKANRIAYANELAAHYKDGKTLKEIGELYGVTRERVRQVLCSVEMNYATSGRKEASQQKKMQVLESRKSHKEQSIFKRYGCSVDEHEEGKKFGYLITFREQRNNAKHRGIEWKLSYKQWLDWWNETGHFDSRGRSKGGFCMSRIGDSGPYSLENIECKTIAENSREALTRKSTKPAEQTGVFKILCGTNKPYLAKYGRVRIGFYETAEDAINARRSYMDGVAAYKPLGKSAGSGRGYYIKKGGYVVMQFRGKSKICKSIEEAQGLYQTLSTQYHQGLTT